MNGEGTFRRRKLPHIDVADKPFFVTACLDGSISSVGLRQIRKYRSGLENQPKPEQLSLHEWELIIHKLVFKFVDLLLDGNVPVRYLEDDRLAEIVQNAFLHFAGERYYLFAFVVMPSHHHWLFQPTEEYSEQLALEQAGKSKRRTPREAISHSIQSYTATMCNRVLDRDGTFWQDETFDHYARNDDESMRIIHYIEQNPVVAGLASEAHEYRWSSANLRKRLGIPAGDPIFTS